MTKSEQIIASRARAEQMAALYREGQTLQKIGSAYGISREGEALTAAQLAEIAGMRVKSMRARLSAGWSPAKAVKTPITINNSHLRRLQAEQRA